MSATGETTQEKALIRALGPDELGVMDALGENGPLDDTSLSAEAGLSISAAHKAATNLVELGFAQLDPDDEARFALVEAKLDAVLDGVNASAKQALRNSAARQPD